jgi:hypothetical protein
VREVRAHLSRGSTIERVIFTSFSDDVERAYRAVLAERKEAEG